jgi:hypothetical protein
LAEAALNKALPAGSPRLTVTLKEACTVMRRDHGMRYRKIKDTAMHSNSDKNLVLRQRWALEFLSLSKNNKQYLCIDETWLGMSDFRRRKWQVPGTTNSVGKLAIAPRITMILGIDSTGNVYYSLAQANSNSSMMEIYFRELVVILDRDKPSWRNNLVILVDGASYHQSKEFKTVAAKLRLPFMLFGPHSYDTSPCELFFASFKSLDINPRHIPTGKTHFDNIAQLVRLRIDRMDKSHILLYWHHCLEFVYRFLCYHRL